MRIIIRVFMTFSSFCLLRKSTKMSKRDNVTSPIKRQKIECNATELDNSQNPLHDIESGFKFSDETSLEKIRQIQELFCMERNWEQYHSPRNILLALVGEVGELAEIFQWKGEVSKGLTEFTEKEKEHVGQEMSDVLVYLVRLADRCEIDLSKAVLSKIEQNKLKYPVNKVFGKSEKYTEYDG